MFMLPINISKWIIYGKNEKRCSSFDPLAVYFLLMRTLKEKGGEKAQRWMRSALSHPQVNQKGLV